MSITCRVRHAFGFALVTSAFLYGLSPAALKAGENDGGLVPPAQYVSLPSQSGMNDPKTTGSLPNARALSGFSSLVSQGAITLRASAPTNCVPGNLREVVASIAE